MTRNALALGILVLVCTAAPAFAGGEGASFGERFANRNCAWCHGSSLQGYTSAPRLAGQTRQYLQKQFAGFANHTRDNPLSKQFMWGAPVHLSPFAARELASYLASIPPEPARDGDASHAERGRALYVAGNQAANIPACGACHGPQAQGAGAVPRLAGLSYFYLKRKLEQWAQGYHAAAGPPMPGIATEMSKNDVAALASYLSFLP
jgi:cytochrome c553